MSLFLRDNAAHVTKQPYTARLPPVSRAALTKQRQQNASAGKKKVAVCNIPAKPCRLGALQKTAKRMPKGHLLQRERRPFTMQKATFCIVSKGSRYCCNINQKPRPGMQNASRNAASSYSFQRPNRHTAAFAACIMPRQCRKAYFLRVNSKRNPPVMLFPTLIVPPCSSTEFFTMASPRPVPPILRLRPLSTR